MTRLREIIERAGNRAFCTEAEMQTWLDAELRGAGIEYKREASIGSRGRPDFMVTEDGKRIAVECKIKGSRTAVLEQVCTYAYSDEVDEVALITTRKTHQMPGMLNRKPVSVFVVGGFLA